MTALPALLVFGASRGTGLEVVRQARARRQPVSAMVRAFSAELERLGVAQYIGDCLDRERVRTVCEICEADAVVCTVGSSRAERSADGEGAINVIDGAEEAGIRRFVMVSSLGAGESRAYASDALLQAIGDILEEKTRAEEHLNASGLDATILRPGGLVNDPPDKGGVLIERPDVHGYVSRRELASLILGCVDNSDTIGRAYSVIDRAYAS